MGMGARVRQRPKAPPDPQRPAIDPDIGDCAIADADEAGIRPRESGPVEGAAAGLSDTVTPVNPFSLSGRTALVTGAGSPTGIGLATSRLLATMGATVWLTATTDRVHDRAQELRADGLAAEALVADLTDPEEAAATVQAAASAQGLHIVVNNAGMASVGMIDATAEAGDLAAMPLRTWHDGLARNLDTAFLVTRTAIPHMREAGWGRIVMVASVTGPVMAMRSEPVYAAAKAGMVGLMRALAVDLAPDGITANAVAPGWIATGSQLPHEVREGQHTPFGRSGRPEEVAAAVAWFATPEASYCSGQLLVVDGAAGIVEERALPQ
jgi:3-oxoacyl-[acyl-carrier protein] reductase